MKIIKNNSDVKELKFGEEYIIGFDFEKPESYDPDKIQRLQYFIDRKFNTQE